MSEPEPKRDLPQQFELTNFNEEFRCNPYPALETARAQTPVMRHGIFDTLVLRAKEVQWVLRAKNLFTDPRKSNPDSSLRLLGFDLASEPSMLFADDPDHKRLRGLVNKAFTPKAVEAMRPRAREIVQQLLDEITTPEFNFIEAFAAPLPTIVIAEMLGVDPERRREFKTWSDQTSGSFFNGMRTEDQSRMAEQATEQLFDLFREEIAKRRVAPAEDLISAMVAAEQDGDKFTEDEIVQQCNLLLIAGNITTTDLIGNGMKALLDHPDQMQALREAPELIPNAVEEMLRYDSPVINAGRIADDEMEIAGCPIHKGEQIAVSLAAANRDPDLNPDPDRFDVRRTNPQYVSFGGGRHFCLGAPLAKLEAQEAFRGLLARYARLRASQRPVVYRAVPGFRGMDEFWVRSDAA